MDDSTPAKPILGKRYQIMQTLGTGGMSVVYRAQDLMLERQVAIKLLRQRYTRDEGFRQRFHQEAKSAANLSHPNIVTVYDFGLDIDRLYIVMEYVPGTDLKTLIKQKGLYPVQECIMLIAQACSGIGYAHRAGLVHCDVKPHNMLVTPNQRLKVTDFGIARVMATIRPDEQHDVVWGSPLYFSPEQAAGEPPSPASDVYSLGVILYEMLTGQTPFISNDASELVDMHRDAQPVPPTQINPEIPPSVEQVILKVLSKNPASRYSTADQLGRVLQSLGDHYHNLSSTIPSVHTLSQAETRITYAQTGKIDGDVNKVKTTMDDNGIIGIDWITVGLGLITFITVGSLIPFWLYIWFTIRSP